MNALTGKFVSDPPPRDKHLRRSAADYAYAFQTLMPRGQAWPREPTSVLRRVCDALAWFWGFVDGRVADLLEIESDPQKTVELLPEWERAFGLPEECFPEATTIGERQRMLVTKMTWQGGQSRAYFIDLMAWLGFRVIITEWAPFMAGISRCGDTRPTEDDDVHRWYIGPPEGRFVWTAQVGYSGLVWFRAGAGQAGVDSHLQFRNPLEVECLLQRWKPAHTFLRFDYTPLDWSDPMEGTP
jgi:uncharacterized protein YmfQ (DUF2313 family)